MSKRYGYGRVSSLGQQLQGNSLEEQERVLREAGAEEVVLECYTGKEIDRPKFTPLLNKLKKGDTLFVTKLDRFARATEAVAVIKELVDRGVTVNILNFGLANNSATGTLMLNILASFAQYEREMIFERTQEGKAAKKSTDPNWKPGPKRMNIHPEFQKYKNMVVNEEMTVVDACESMGVSRSTWYKWMKEVA